jgi:tetratricopeptide (TPR) repeat protein
VAVEPGPRGWLSSRDNLGTTYTELRLFEEAITCFQQGLAIFQEVGDRDSEGRILGNLGIAYSGLRQPGRAAGCWREAAAAMRDAGDHEKSGRLEQLAASAHSRLRRRWGLRRRLSP